MDAGRTFLRDPRQPTIQGCDDATVSTHRPAMRRMTVGRERNRGKMIFGRGTDLGPFLTGVFGDHDRAARADYYRALRILHVKTIETRDQSRALARPLKATIGGVKNHSIRAYRPSVEFVTGETNGADRITLRSRVLPFPSTIGCLRERRRGG